MMRVVGAEDQDCENFEICMKITVREWDESAAHRLFYLFLFFNFFIIISLREWILTIRP